MKRKIVVFQFLCLLLLNLFITPLQARDFLGEFVYENYKEAQETFSHFPLIYHSIQINTSAGPKLVVLEGDDNHYRKWLRHYISEGKTLILKINDERNDEFISSKVFSMDIKSLHPVDGKKWSGFDINKGLTDKMVGDNYILIIDSNQKRGQLITTIIEKMGYQSIVFKDVFKAMTSFKLQPEKFKMIIAHHESINFDAKKFIDQTLKIDNKIPVVVDTGYKNLALTKQLNTIYLKSPSVFVKPVILNELSKTIEKLLQNNA